MEQVSAAWIENQKQSFVNESDVEIKLTVTDPDAQADAKAADNGSIRLSDTASVVDSAGNNPQKYAMLEPLLWRLNGTYVIPEDGSPSTKNGFISSVLSDDQKEFATKPVVTITFSKVFTSLLQGLTITWGSVYGNEYATNFTIQAYNGDSLVASKDVTDNQSVVSTILFDIQNYNKMVITVNAWNFAHHRARIEKILIGIEHIYSKSDLKSFSHSQSVDLLSASLPNNEIKMEVFNLEGLYDPSNPTGLGKYLMERQPVTVRYGYLINGMTEWIPAGRFYLSEWETPRNGIVASFTARDQQELLSDIYSGPATGTLYDIAEAAFTQADLPGESPWHLDESLKNITAASGADLKDLSIAEVLELVANAGCCVMYQDRDGVFRIEPYNPVVSNDYEITGSNSYSFPETVLSTQLKGINVNDGQHVLTVGTVGDVQAISNQLISDEQAPKVAEWAKGLLLQRQSVSGEFRIDPRLDCLDVVPIDTPFATVNVAISSIEITFNGAYRGSYEGRVLSE